MLLEFIDGPRLSAIELTEDAAVAVAREIQDEMDNISGEFPLGNVFGDETHWRAFVESILRDLDELIKDGQYTHVNADMVRTLERCALSSPVLESLSMNIGLWQGDFAGGNILVGKDGYKVIDWHPARGPRDLELANFLADRGIDPARHVDRGVLIIRRVLGIEYLVYCTKTGIRSAAGNDPDTAVYIAEMEGLLDGRSGSR